MKAGDGHCLLLAVVVPFSVDVRRHDAERRATLWCDAPRRTPSNNCQVQTLHLETIPGTEEPLVSRIRFFITGTDLPITRILPNSSIAEGSNSSLPASWYQHVGGAIPKRS